MSAFSSASAFESTSTAPPPPPPLFANDFFNMTTYASTNANGAANIGSIPSLINNQIKFDYEQHNAIKLQQLEAIRLIQISYDKLASATTVPLPMPANQSAGESGSTSTVFVYKDTNLHKNLLVSKILNKAKFCYYQSIVQSMRFSLMSKLNYYSALIQQLNATQSEKKSNAADENNNSTNMSMNYDETSIIDEMKLLMQQIWQETYQFNLNHPFFEPLDPNISTFSTPSPSLPAQSDNSCRDSSASSLDADSDEVKPTNAVSVESDSKSKSDETTISNAAETEQMKRIKQLNDVKLSLYSLLFNPSGSDSVSVNENEKCSSSSKKTNENFKRKRQTKKDSQDEVLDVVTVSDSSEKHSSKKPRSELDDIDEECCTTKPATVVDVKSHADILNDDTNVIKNKICQNNHVNSKEKSSKSQTSYGQNGLARHQHRNDRLLNRYKSVKSTNSAEDKSAALKASQPSILAKSMSSPSLSSSSMKIQSRPSMLRLSSPSAKSSKLLPSISMNNSSTSPSSNFINLKVLF